MRRGDVVAGKYRLVRELGSGSQGRVWEALHLQMDTPLAMKVLDPNLASRPDYVSRFKREASAAAALRSAHVVQIFDFGLWQDVPYIAMELLEGEDLGTRLDRVRRMPPAEVAGVVTQVARALVRAHKRGIIHRDMKPDNIYLCDGEEGEAEIVKILDFGVAKAVDGISLARTGTGVVLGTPYYMSPEQAQGEKRVDHRTDLWALGVITFEAMVGRRPFEATNLGDLLVKICAQDPPTPSSVYAGVPDGFDNWFLRACARNPEERFSSAKEMAATLAILCGSIPATLSDSSYVALFQKGLPAEESEASIDHARAKGYASGRQGHRGRAQEHTPAPVTVREPAPSSAENEPTQVMTDLPAGMIDDDPQIPISIAPEERTPVPPNALTLPPRVMIGSEVPPKLRTSSALRSPEPSGEEEDPVEMFDAADVAKNMAEVRRELRRAETKKHRQELVRSYSLPAMAIGIAILIVVAYLIAR